MAFNPAESRRHEIPYHDKPTNNPTKGKNGMTRFAQLSSHFLYGIGTMQNMPKDMKNPLRNLFIQR